MNERKPTAPHEHFEQVALFDWLEVQAKQHPEMGDFYAIPNGGYRDPRSVRKLQSEGVRPGVPDIETFHARRGFTGLHIEMKRRWGYTVDEKQWAMIDRMNGARRLAVVARGWEEAACWIEWYFDKRLFPNTMYEPCLGLKEFPDPRKYIKENVWGDPKKRIL